MSAHIRVCLRTSKYYPVGASFSFCFGFSCTSYKQKESADGRGSVAAWFCSVWLWPVDFACFSSASAVARCLWSLEALVALCRLRLLPFLGVCVQKASGKGGCKKEHFGVHVTSK
jgi:hypothetical protein